MAVPKSKVSRAKRGTRRSQDGLKSSTLSIDATTGEKHHRHHVSANGYYRGRQVIDTTETEQDDD